MADSENSDVSRGTSLAKLERRIEVLESADVREAVANLIECFEALMGRLEALEAKQWREGPPITQRETPDGIEVRVPVEVKLTTPMYSARITGVQEPSE